MANPVGQLVAHGVYRQGTNDRVEVVVAALARRFETEFASARRLGLARAGALWSHASVRLWRGRLGLMLVAAATLVGFFEPILGLQLVFVAPVVAWIAGTLARRRLSTETIRGAGGAWSLLRTFDALRRSAMPSQQAHLEPVEQRHHATMVESMSAAVTTSAIFIPMLSWMIWPPLVEHWAELTLLALPGQIAICVILHNRFEQSKQVSRRRQFLWFACAWTAAALAAASVTLLAAGPVVAALVLLFGGLPSLTVGAFAFFFAWTTSARAQSKDAAVDKAIMHVREEQEPVRQRLLALAEESENFFGRMQL